MIHRILCFFGFHAYRGHYIAVPTTDLEHVHDVTFCPYCGKAKVLS